jgi:hypothetical protein
MRNNGGNLSVGLEKVEQSREHNNLATAQAARSASLISDDDHLPLKVIEMFRVGLYRGLPLLSVVVTQTVGGENILDSADDIR